MRSTKFSFVWPFGAPFLSFRARADLGFGRQITRFNQRRKFDSNRAQVRAKTPRMFGTKQQQRECTPLHDKSRAAKFGLEHPEGLEPRMLLDEHSSDSDENGCGTNDLLIQGLVNRLPKPDSNWSLDLRAKWLQTAASIFGLVYKASDGEDREISVVLDKDADAKPSSSAFKPL